MFAVSPVELAVTAPPATLREVLAFRVPMVEVPMIALAAVSEEVAVSEPNTPKPPVMPLVVAPVENVWSAVHELATESDAPLPAPIHVPAIEKQPFSRFKPFENVDDAVVEVAVM